MKNYRMAQGSWSFINKVCKETIAVHKWCGRQVQIFGRLWSPWFSVVPVCFSGDMSNVLSYVPMLLLWRHELCSKLCTDAPQHFLRRSSEKFSPDCLSTTVEHGRGGIMVWGCFLHLVLVSWSDVKSPLTQRSNKRNYRKGCFLA